MILDITPKVGLGPLRLGMTITEVREGLGLPFESFLKTPKSKVPTDAFDSVGVFVYYKKPGICQAIEVAIPGDPRFDGKRLLGQRFDRIRKWVATLDQNVEVDDTGLISKQLGIGFFVPDLTEGGNAPIESVIVFEDGYYD